MNEPRRKVTDGSDSCQLFCLKLSCMQKCANIKLFVLVMMIAIGVQGTYLGYTVGVLTSIERRFEISSKKSGSLLSCYDIGHTLAVLFVGYFGATGHKPRWTAIGVIASALAMFGLALPVLIYGAITDHDSESYGLDQYQSKNKCQNPPFWTGSSDWQDWQVNEKNCQQEHEEHTGAYVIMVASQVLAGIAAAPFNTLAYVYVDDNLTNRQQSPFYLGLLTSMYAFGPALGFGLSALTTRVYARPGHAPDELNINSTHWVGAWWIGFLVCGALYLLCAIPLLMFPKNLVEMDHSLEMEPLRTGNRPSDDSHDTADDGAIKRLCMSLKDFPEAIWTLVRNPIFTSMVVGWIFGSYLVGGYATYLPKYIETQYGRSASAADFYAGFISIGSVAVSTAIGGFILTRFNIQPRAATLCLIGTWFVVLITYLLGLFTGCPQPQLSGTRVDDTTWNYLKTCNQNCNCNGILEFDPVCYAETKTTFFSPCHAGCQSYNSESKKWQNCACAQGKEMDLGLCSTACGRLVYYLLITWGGLFIGNLFFMSTMMVVLRCVYDDQKAIALSVASCVTNVLGFIPAPILFGWVIDSSCVTWHSRCPQDRGNCIIYDNDEFRIKFHVGNAGFQLLAVIATAVCYLISRTRKLPEEEYAEQHSADHSIT